MINGHFKIILGVVLSVVLMAAVGLLTWLLVTVNDLSVITARLAVQCSSLEIQSLFK